MTTRYLMASARVIAVAMAVFHLYTASFGNLEPLLQRSVHLLAVLALVFLPASTAGRSLWSTLPFLIGALASLGYLVVRYDYVGGGGRLIYVTPVTSLEIGLAVALIAVILEASRRLHGVALPAICGVFIAYAFAGPSLPWFFGHKGVSLAAFAENMLLTDEGVFGIPLGVSASLIVIFTILAGFLGTTGGSHFFIQLGTAIAGGMRGGAGKIAILSSSFFGTISGSAVANVVGTGTITIPMMMKLGYRPEFAGAVEAVASTGGQIMPPIMGAAAFIMADFLGIPYLQLIKHALIPALLYYAAFFVMVDAEAARLGLRAVARADRPPLLTTLLGGLHLLAPIVLLLWLLLSGFSPMLSAVGSILALVLASFARRATWPTLSRVLEALENGAKSAVSPAVACAAAGIIIGVDSISGLGLKLTTIVLEVSGGNLLATLIMTMIAGLVLGMGLPTTAAYLVQAALLAPALINLGVTPVAAHLFVFYYACLSAITPPVALASFAAAAISGAPVTRTGWTGVRLALAAYIVPFMFVYGPSLLLIGAWHEVLLNLLTASVGILMFGYGVQGYFAGRMRLSARVVTVFGGLALIKPGMYTDLAGVLALATALFLQFVLARIRRTSLEQAQTATGVRRN